MLRLFKNYLMDKQMSSILTIEFLFHKSVPNVTVIK